MLSIALVYILKKEEEFNNRNCLHVFSLRKICNFVFFFFSMSKFSPKNTGTEGLRLVALTSIDVVVLYQLSYPMRLIIFNFEFSYT